MAQNPRYYEDLGLDCQGQQETTSENVRCYALLLWLPYEAVQSFCMLLQ